MIFSYLVHLVILELIWCIYLPDEIYTKGSAATPAYRHIQTTKQISNELTSDATKIANENYFPGVIYPTSILDVAQPFFYRVNAQDQVLGPFSDDVKSSYKLISSKTGDSKNKNNIILKNISESQENFESGIENDRNTSSEPNSKENEDNDEIISELSNENTNKIFEDKFMTNRHNTCLSCSTYASQSDRVTGVQENAAYSHVENALKDISDEDGNFSEEMEIPTQEKIYEIHNTICDFKSPEVIQDNTLDSEMDFINETKKDLLKKDLDPKNIDLTRQNIFFNNHNLTSNKVIEMDLNETLPPLPVGCLESENVISNILIKPTEEFSLEESLNMISKINCSNNTIGNLAFNETGSNPEEILSILENDTYNDYDTNCTDINNDGPGPQDDSDEFFLDMIISLDSICEMNDTTSPYKEQVTNFIEIPIIHQTNVSSENTELIFCLPYSYEQFNFRGNSYPKNYITNALQSDQIINTEPICRKFHFPETEYPFASISDIPYNFQEIENKSCFKTRMNTNSHLKNYSKNYINSNYNNHDMKTIDNGHTNEFPLSSSHYDIRSFPDIEYPMSASELWKPYYWSCPNNFKNLYSDQPSTYPKLNHTLTRKELINNFRKLSTRGKTIPVSTKSFSDPQKNNPMLKNNQQNKNTTLQKHNENIKLIKNIGTICKTTEPKLTSFNKSISLHPNYHVKNKSYSVAEDKSINKYNSNDRNSSALPAKEKCNNSSFSEIGVVASDHKLKDTENVVKSYTDRFNKEMSAVLRNIADKIILNDHKQFERNVIDSPNMYLMNNGDDSFYQVPTENDVTLYANEFNNKMTSIIKSVADNIFLKSTEVPNIKMYTDTSHSIEECFKPDYEKIVKYSEKSINTYADRFNDEMSSIINSNFDDIIFDNVNWKYEMNTDSNFSNFYSNYSSENPLQSNINCPLQNDEVCKVTDLFELNRTLSKQKSDTILLLDDSNSGKEMFTKVVGTKYDNSYEDYTTDAYPETDNSWSLYSQTTVAPKISSVDTTWKSSKVIEPDKTFNSEELDQYFMLV